jgi:CheY-like chemotaxis protein
MTIASDRALRVLVVDDYPDTTESTAEVLRLDGDDVVTASDGVEGIKRAAEFRPDLVLLDIGLPMLDGYAIARRIQHLRYQPKPFIAAVTGYGMQDDKRRSGEAGFDLHLLKPVDPETYRGLAALLQTSADLVIHLRSLAAQHRLIATDVLFRTLEMANIYLDTAALSDSRKDQSVTLATEAYDRLIAWLDRGACIDDRAAELVNGLRALNERLKLMRKPPRLIERRKVSRENTRRQVSQ